MVTTKKGPSDAAKVAAVGTTRDAAKVADVASETIRYWARTGRLPFTRTAGGVRLFDLAHVARVASEQRARRRGQTEAADE